MRRFNPHRCLLGSSDELAERCLKRPLLQRSVPCHCHVDWSSRGDAGDRPGRIFKIRLVRHAREVRFADFAYELLEDPYPIDQPGEFLLGDFVVWGVTRIDMGAAQQFE